MAKQALSAYAYIYWFFDEQNYSYPEATKKGVYLCRMILQPSCFLMSRVVLVFLNLLGMNKPDLLFPKSYL